MGALEAVYNKLVSRRVGVVGHCGHLELSAYEGLLWERPIGGCRHQRRTIKTYVISA